MPKVTKKDLRNQTYTHTHTQQSQPKVSRRKIKIIAGINEAGKKKKSRTSIKTMVGLLKTSRNLSNL